MTGERRISAIKMMALESVLETKIMTTLASTQQQWNLLLTLIFNERKFPFE